MLIPWKESYDQLSILKSRDITLPTKVHLVKAMVFPVVWMWELDYKESWVPMNWCSWTVVLEKTLESPLDCKEIQPVHPKRDQSWVFIGGTDVEAETPILWPPDEKSWLIWKDPDAGRDWGQEEKGTAEDEMVGWHHRLNGNEFGWTPGVGDGQGGLGCYSSWGQKDSNTTEWLNWTELKSIHVAENGINSLFFYDCVILYCVSVWVWHILLIHSSIDGHLDCFHILSIVDSCFYELWGEHIFLN